MASDERSTPTTSNVYTDEAYQLALVAATIVGPTVLQLPSRTTLPPATPVQSAIRYAVELLDEATNALNAAAGGSK